MLWTTQCVWLPHRWWLAGHPGKDDGNCLWSLVSWVACIGSPALSFMPHCLSPRGTVELFTCPLSRMLTKPHRLTSVTQFHCTTATAYIMSGRSWRWQVASVHFSDADWSEYGAWRYWLSHTAEQVQPPVCHISCQPSPSPIGSHALPLCHVEGMSFTHWLRPGVA